MAERFIPIDFQQGSSSKGETPDVPAVIVTEGMTVEQLVAIVDGNSSRGRGNGVPSRPNAHPERLEKEDIAPSPFTKPVDMRT